MAKLKNKKTTKIKRLLVTFILLLIVSIPILLFPPFNKKIYPNIKVTGIEIGNLSKDEAINKLKTKTVAPTKITLKLDNFNSEISLSELDFSINYEKTIDRAYNYSNTGNYLKDLVTKISLLSQPKDLVFEIDINKSKLLESLVITSSKIGSPAIDPSAKIVGKEIVINPGKDGLEIDISKLEHEIDYSLSTLGGNSFDIPMRNVSVSLDNKKQEEYKNLTEKLIGKKIDFKLEFDSYLLDDRLLVSFVEPNGEFNDTKIKNEVTKISTSLNRNPQNSVFIVEDKKVKEFVPSKDGVTVDEDKLMKIINDHLKLLLTGNEVAYILDIPVVKNPAKIKNEDVNSLGINELLGKGSSNFKGSIPNRIYNVNLAQSKFKGTLIAPGETFSFNKILGDVSSLTGYKSAYVIQDGKTVLGDGGGVCQVSTTLFRAVLAAGLPIIERRAHSYRVGYYEQGFPPGLDATVFYPTTDFKFKNDTSAHLLIQPTIDLNKLTLNFEIYGTSDGRIAETTKPTIASSTAPGPDVYVDDPSLPMGTTKQIEHRAWGAKVIFDYKVTRNGEEITSQKFISNYRPWQAVYLKGTGSIVN